MAGASQARAVMAAQFGPPENYALVEYDAGEPAPDEIVLAIQAAGISYVDVLTARGEYQFRPPLPFIPGSEVAGVIVKLGANVEHLAVGDAVFGSSLGGCFAEVGRFRASSFHRIPAGMNFAEAAIFPVNYMTAYHALSDRARVRKGESLLVLGAAGGTGFAAVEVGKYLGLRVIASASSAEKRAAALAGGADAAVDARADDWRDQVMAANDGKPIDIIFDPVGGEGTERAFRTLGYDGRHLVIGFPAGIASLKCNLPLLKTASLIGVQLRAHALNRPDEAAALRAQVMALAEQNIFHPLIAETYPISQFAAAMDRVFSGQANGRIVLTMGEGG